MDLQPLFRQAEAQAAVIAAQKRYAVCRERFSSQKKESEEN
jgi:hypothetical protein